MPKTPDYSQTIIYKLINYDHPELVYVGHTTNFIRRKAEHKRMVSENSQIKLYRTIQQHGGWESWHMIKICDYPCSSSLDARQEEDRHMTQLKANLNTVKAYTSDEEKKEQRKIFHKQYRETNRDQLNEQKKQYYESNKERIKDQAKQYRDSHKDQINKFVKQYYESNKEQISKKAAEKIKCECGCHIRKGGVAEHKKTAKHQRNLSSNSSSESSSE